MRIVFLIFLTAFVKSLNAQVLFDLKRDVNLEGWTSPVSEEVKAEVLKKVEANGSIGWVVYSMENGDSTSLVNLHMVDFNCDGIHDFIYTGSVGAESDGIIFLQGNSNGIYTRVLGLFGRLIDVSVNDGLSPMSFTIENYGCCGGVIDHIEKYVPVWNSSKFSFALQARYAMYYETDLPQTSFEKPIAFKTTNEKYFLRLNPCINDTILLDHDEVGNIFAEYPKDSDGIAIAEQIDNTGRVWWFVMMKNNIKPNWSLYVNGDNNDSPAYYLGWVSSRFVKKIE
ncbi:hypothetical protein [Mangrovibacterium diazotrophicum]|nr:hypothetical protein [Mangrovibacterium diazotrophicum]